MLTVDSNSNFYTVCTAHASNYCSDSVSVIYATVHYTCSRRTVGLAFWGRGVIMVLSRPQRPRSAPTCELFPNRDALITSSTLWMARPEALHPFHWWTQSHSTGTEDLVKAITHTHTHTRQWSLENYALQNEVVCRFREVFFLYDLIKTTVNMAS